MTALSTLPELIWAMACEVFTDVVARAAAEHGRTARRTTTMATAAQSHHDLTTRLRSISLRGAAGTAFLLITWEFAVDVHDLTWTVHGSPRASARRPATDQRAAESSRSGRRTHAGTSSVSAGAAVSGTGSLDVDGRFQSADIGQIPVLLGVVQAVADDEVIGDVEADVLTSTSTLTASGLRSSETISIEAGTRLQVLQQPGQRQPGVDDVLDDQHVLPGDIPIEVLEDPHHTGRGRDEP